MTANKLIQALRSPFSGPATTGPGASALPPDALDAARRFAECNVGDPWTEEHAERWWREHLPKAAASAAGVATGSFISHI